MDAHLDEVLRWNQLSRVQRENCIVDSIAKDALMDAVMEDNFIASIFPHEQVVVKVDGRRVTGSPKSAISRAWGYKVARELFHSRKIVDKKHFRLIYWDGVEASMKTFPTMFRVWVLISVVRTDNSLASTHQCPTHAPVAAVTTKTRPTCTLHISRSHIFLH